MMKSQISIAVLFFFIAHFSLAQGTIPLEQFKQKNKSAISLPYSIDRLWLFESDGGWGIYSEANGQVLVPPNYELVLPTLVNGIFYVTRGDYAGIYAGMELIPPNQYSNLHLLSDDSGNFFVQNKNEIVEKRGAYTTYSAEFTTFELKRSADGKWSVTKTGSSSIDSNTFAPHEDSIEKLSDTDWIHHHAHIDITEVDPEFDVEPGFAISKVLQQSSIISADDKGYRIPPQYVTIEAKDTYFRVEESKAPSAIPVPYNIFTKSGIYDSNFKMMLPPVDGDFGLLEGGGYYGNNGTTLVLLESDGREIFVLKDFRKSIHHVLKRHEKFYVACSSDDDEELEMNIYDQHIYSRDGRLITRKPFSLGTVYDNQNTTVITQIGPKDSYEVRYGLYNLETDEVLLASKYNDVRSWDYAETLSIREENDCTGYYDFVLSETHHYVNCSGDPISVIDLDVSGRNYVINRVDEEALRVALHSDSGLPFEPTYSIEEDRFGDEDWMSEPSSMWSSIADEYSGITIYKVYNENQKTLTYGLSQSDKKKLILAPVFEEINFDKKTDRVKLTYQSRQYDFPLSRYKND